MYSLWTNAELVDDTLTIDDPTQSVTYTYDLGNGYKETFTLIPVFLDRMSKAM